MICYLIDMEAIKPPKGETTMTREDILKDYAIDKCGKIISPGKFEGGCVYLPYYYDLWLNGEGLSVYGADDEIISTAFDVEPQEREMFPELGSQEQVIFYERSDGFVIER
jgi:hypothetical protein